MRQHILNKLFQIGSSIVETECVSVPYYKHCSELKSKKWWDGCFPISQFLIMSSSIEKLINKLEGLHHVLHLSYWNVYFLCIWFKWQLIPRGCLLPQTVSPLLCTALPHCCGIMVLSFSFSFAKRNLSFVHQGFNLFFFFFFSLSFLGDSVLDGSSTLTLQVTCIQHLTHLFEQYLITRTRQHGFLALPSHPADTTSLLQVQFLFDMLQKTISLKVWN